MEKKVPKNIKDLKGTETEKNLWTALAGESEARVRYEFFSDKAKEEGYEQIGYFFDETSWNEREHAEIWFDYLGQMGDTVKNLKKSMTLENYESDKMYLDFAEIAKKEGFDEISEKFRLVAGIEKTHSERFKKLRQNILDNKVFSRPNSVIWQCRNCGYLVTDMKAPDICPVCEYPQGFYQLNEENY